MKFLILFACLALASSKTLHSIKGLEYGFCDGAAEIGTLSISVVPDPIVVATGETITLSVVVELAEAIPAGTQVSLSIKKEGLIDIPLPCIEVDGLHLGSCDYDGDELLARFAEAVCPAYVPAGQECALPLNPGSYGGDPPVVIEIPEIPSVIGDLLGSGYYYVEANMPGVSCIFARIELA